MKYKTSYLYKYDLETRTEHLKEYQTPDTLNGMKLFAIGGTYKDNFHDNWDIYATPDGALYAIARTGTGCNNSYFGDVNHIRNLMRAGHWSDTLTPYGFELMNYRNRRTA